MSEKNNTSKILGIAVLVAVIAAALYLVMGVKTTPPSGEATPTTEQSVEQNTDQSAPPQPEPQASEDVTQDKIVVETKTLPIVEAAKYPVAEETGDATIQNMMGDRKLGSDNAPIKVVEYSSLTCGHCAAFHNTDLAKIKEEFIDTGKVQFIFKEYPLNQPAVVASQILRCMPADKFVSFMGLLFEQQEKWAYEADYKDKVIQYAKFAGLGEDEINSCINNVGLEKRIVGDMQAAHDKFNISSTPSFVVNGGEKMIVGHQPVSFFESTFNELLGTSSTPAATDAEPAKQE